MTLVISVATDDAVIQASDRRLVWLEQDGSYRLKDDNRNKAVVFGSRMVFAYTGLANLGPRRQHTDDWLAATIATSLHDGGDQSEILRKLAASSTTRLNHGLHKGLSPRQRFHEFVSVGWACFPESTFKDFRPYFGWVSNFRNETGELLPDPSGEFQMGFSQLGRNNDFEILVSGQALPDDHLQELRCDVASTHGDIEEIVGALIHHVRKAAASNDAVGQGVLLNVLPKSVIRAGDTSTTLILGGPAEEVASFFNVPANSSDPSRYGPTFFSPSGGIMSGFTVAAQPEHGETGDQVL
jgi:hypothetical protein